MDTVTTTGVSHKQELCVIAYIMTHEIIARNTRPNFDECYNEVLRSLRQRQQQQQEGR